MENIIKIQGLSAAYEKNIILDDINFEIPEGEISFIIGPSGCGKTTLLKSILMLNPPRKGKVFLFDKDFTLMEEKERQRILEKIGVQFQNSALLNSMTVFDNIAVPLRQNTDLPEKIISIIIQQKLKQLGLLAAINQFPSELSGGMKTRVAFARAIALDPKIVFFDEPTAGLDPISSRNIDNLILNLKKDFNITPIIISHDKNSIQDLAERIIFLNKGKLVFNGSAQKAYSTQIKDLQDFFGS